MGSGLFVRLLVTAMALAALLVTAPGAAAGKDDSLSRKPHVRDVRVVRDTWGVPHVYAGDTEDLFYGYGYSIAQDRLFQIEVAKRSFTGTVAEALGPEYAALDADTRANRDPDSIQRQYKRLSRRDKEIFEGYADGVNAWIAKVKRDPGRLLPKQFQQFGFQPEPWTGLDVVMIFVGSMANRYSDATNELANLAARDALIAADGQQRGLALFDQVRWNFDPLAPTTVQPEDVEDPGRARASVARKRAPNLRRLQPVTKRAVNSVRRPIPFSNVWVLGAKKTFGADSVLVNGPQHGDFTPAFVYSVGLHGAGFDLVGNAGFGYPAVYFGRNADVGWGATAGGNDTVDIYQEQLNPSDSHEYLYKGRYRRMRHRTETFAVRGSDPVTIDVYYTVHGRVTAFDTARNVAYSKKRSWEGSELETLVAWVDITKARNWRQWRRAASRMAVSVNFYYNDRWGNIGYANTGKYPIRPSNQDQRLPALGTGEMEWEGIQPFSDNFQVFNPKQGYITNWNNKQHPAATGEFGDIQRVTIINDLIDARPSFTPEDAWNLNRDVALTTISAKQFLPFLEQAVRSEPDDSRPKQAVELLSGWNQLGEDQNHDGLYDSPAYSIFTRWLTIVTDVILNDDLPSAVVNGPLRGGGGGNTIVAYHALRGAQAGVPQTIDLLGGESPDAVVRRALAMTIDQLTAGSGPDMQRWLTPVRPHVFGTKNFVGVPQALPEEEKRLPLFMFRGTENHLVAFTGGVSRGCEVTPPGQSGFLAPSGAMSPHYDDQLQLYGNWGCKPTWLSPDEVRNHAESVTTLRP